jgi:hypothetical protein
MPKPVDLFSIADDDDTRAARERDLDDAKRDYQWYRDYLPPIATLFNARLGDHAPHTPAPPPLPATERDGYDDQTGVPNSAVPQQIPDYSSELSYVLQRGVFNEGTGGVTAGLLASKPPLRTPGDYQVLYDAYLAYSSDATLRAFDGTRISGKVLGFASSPRMYDDDTLFGWQRLAGTNPRALQKLTSRLLSSFLGKMPITDEQLRRVAWAGATVAG